MSDIKHARKLADERAALEADSKRSGALEAHFLHATPEQLVEMWSTRLNLDGQALSTFEFAALVEAWCRVFGRLPPTEEEIAAVDLGDDDQAPAAEQVTTIDDDQMLRTREVLKLTGLSLSTLKRMVQAGRFPRPSRIATRRNAWKASVVRAWLTRFDDEARRTTH
jgi:prophage regulatory protein